MRFHSKILLFGEYGLVLGGEGMAIPFPVFGGSLQLSKSFQSSQSTQSNKSLRLLYNYLKQRKSDFDFMRLSQFESDLENGLWFDSNIPNGYGLGSSGALVAALCKKYQLDEEDLHYLIKNQLALIESYFHGSSSGVDPLVSFLNKPLLIQNNEVTILNEWEIESLVYSVYLVDTKILSRTQNLVEWFIEQQSRSIFKLKTTEDFLEINQKIISQVQFEKEVNFDDILVISKYQLDYLSPMVPAGFRKHFLAGLEHGDFGFKLCGSGGGGYMLCFAKDPVKAIQYLKQNKLEYITVT